MHYVYKFKVTSHIINLSDLSDMKETACSHYYIKLLWNKEHGCMILTLLYSVSKKKKRKLRFNTKSLKIKKTSNKIVISGW